MTDTVCDTASEGPAAVGNSQPVHPRGRWWTAIAGFGLFALVLGLVWVYIGPRLSGEPLSAGARISLHAARREPATQWIRVEPDGADAPWYYASESLLDQSDVVSFRGTYSAAAEPVLSLKLNASGSARLSGLRGTARPANVVILVNDRLKVLATLPQLDGSDLRLVLSGIARSDAEEIFARLTQ